MSKSTYWLPSASQMGEPVGDLVHPPRLDLETDEGRLLEPHGERIGDPHHLHDAAGDEPLGALTNRRLRDMELAADLRVRPATIELQGLDDRLVQVVECWSARRGDGTDRHAGIVAEHASKGQFSVDCRY